MYTARDQHLLNPATYLFGWQKLNAEIGLAQSNANRLSQPRAQSTSVVVVVVYSTPRRL